MDDQRPYRDLTSLGQWMRDLLISGAKKHIGTRCSMPTENVILRKIYLTLVVCLAALFILIVQINSGFGIKVNYSFPKIMLDPLFSNKTISFNCTHEFKRQHFVTLRGLIGRTGNQLFQICMLLATAERNCYTPVLKQKYDLYSLTTMEAIFDLKFIERISAVPSSWYPVESDPYAHQYLNITEKLNSSLNYTFEGFFQKWKYFVGQETYIHSVIKFKPEIIQEVEKYLKDKSFESTIKVGVHVRRADMLQHASDYTQYLINAMQYYTNMLNESKLRLIFIYVSDDITWCKKNIHGDNTYFSPFTSAKDSAGKELALLSMCDHTIITSGTFGWMGAWLGSGKTVYFKGYPKPGSDLERRLNRTSYYPPSWIGLE